MSFCIITIQIKKVVTIFLIILLPQPSFYQEEDDVLGCRIDSSVVTVVDTWNPTNRRTPNEADATQNGVCTQLTSVSNGRISCRYNNMWTKLNFIFYSNKIMIVIINDQPLKFICMTCRHERELETNENWKSQESD